MPAPKGFFIRTGEVVLRLIPATSDFVVRGMPYPGFPLVLDGDMQLVEPAHRFLVHQLLHRGRVQSRKSWPTFGYHMYDYFGFLEGYEFEWDDVLVDEDHSVVAAYREYALDQCGHEESTVNQCLGTVARLYLYGLKRGWIAALPFEMEDVRGSKDGSYLAHADASGGTVSSPDVFLRQKKYPIRVLSSGQIRSLLAAITNQTHRLMTRMGLQVGLRREEIATFPARRVPNPASLPDTGHLIPIELHPGEMAIKGSKPRVLHISRKLLEDLWYYRIHERARRERLSGAEQSPLFLTEFGVPWSADGKSFYDVLTEITHRLGIHAGPHVLRHTYATHTLYGMQRGRDRVDPIVFLKEQLGHASILTTMKYVHLVKELANQAVLDYDNEVTEWSRSVA